MTARRKTETAEETDDKSEEEPKGEQTDQGDGDKSADTGSLDDRIRTMVREAVSALVGDGGKSTRATASDDEDRLARLVRDAQVKLKAEEDKENRFKSVEETLKKVIERPPSREGVGGKLQRWFWGDEK